MRHISRIKAWWNLHFGPPRPMDIARKELLNAKKHLLEHLMHAEYYQAQVDFERKHIKRLTDYIQKGIE